MDHAPIDWHDLAENHNFDFDLRYRTALIDQGVFHFPLAAKQGSISLAHTESDVDDTLDRTRRVLRAM
jgi:glutamate-1-semialdehyde 2,1-aminomutase